MEIKHKRSCLSQGGGAVWNAFKSFMLNVAETLCVICLCENKNLPQTLQKLSYYKTHGPPAYKQTLRVIIFTFLKNSGHLLPVILLTLTATVSHHWETLKALFN